GSAPDLNGLDFFPPLLLGFHAPDCILHFGLPCVSSAWAQYLSTFAGRYLVACGEALREPSRRAQSVIVSAIDSVVDVLRQRVSPRPPPQKGWGNDLCRLRERVNGTVDDALVSFPANTGLSEARAVRTLLEALPTGVELALANSLSVRLASWVWGVSGITVHPHTFRGVNGIDGSVAAAAGICSVSQK